MIPVKSISLLFFSLSFCFLIIHFPSLDAHLYGGVTKQVGNYDVTFQSFPTYPSPNETTTLGISILDEDGLNLFNLPTTIQIFDNDGMVVTTLENIYEFSDIYEPFVFPNTGNYRVLLEAKVPFNAPPISVDFNVVVTEKEDNPSVSSTEGAVPRNSIEPIIIAVVGGGFAIVLGVILARKIRLL